MLFRTNMLSLRQAWLPLCSILFLSTVGLSSSKAEGLDPSHVPADAQWLVHVDYESLSDSQVWQKLRSEKPMLRKMAQGWMKQRYGIDPPKDLKSLTMFSRDYREYTGTVLIQANFDADKIEKLLSKAMNHRKTQWQDHTLHTITLSKQKPSDDGPSGDQEMTIVMVDSDTILLASSVPNGKEALKLLSGESPSLDGKESPLLTDKVEDAWMYGAAINLAELKKHPIAMPILAQHQQITWSFGKQSDGTLYEQADFVAKSEDVAGKMKTVLDGIVAYELLWADGSTPMTTMMKSVEVKRDGRTAGFRWRGSSEQVVAAMDDVFERLQTWKPILMPHQRDNG
ncbi:hypothetical protein Enr13x_44160 [Stieleria neptunia]|uniref:Uncharacterized protein n=1 Tax=Stieleria neptunia TaxID=2527979 RepID=A0A518HUN1_9BACT|nr:hypothetical protein [Stieleria neptunia]QDV44550.1 hypothetical protein Enr13x_44160 [Stieleria neptunia]